MNSLNTPISFFFFVFTEGYQLWSEFEDRKGREIPTERAQPALCKRGLGGGQQEEYHRLDALSNRRVTGHHFPQDNRLSHFFPNPDSYISENATIIPHGGRDMGHNDWVMTWAGIIKSGNLIVNFKICKLLVWGEQFSITLLENIPEFSHNSS